MKNKLKKIINELEELISKIELNEGIVIDNNTFIEDESEGILYIRETIDGKINERYPSDEEFKLYLNYKQNGTKIKN